MSNTFGVREIEASLERLVGKHVILMRENYSTSGKICKISDGYVLLTDVPLKSYGPQGCLFNVSTRTVYVPRGSIGDFYETSLDEIEAFVANSNPFRRYLNQLVRIPDGVDFFGVLSELYDTHVVLLPSLVFYCGEDGYRYRWEKNKPTIIKEPQSVSPITEEDIIAIIKANDMVCDERRRERMEAKKERKE